MRTFLHARPTEIIPPFLPQSDAFRFTPRRARHLSVTIGIVIMATFALAPAASATYAGRNGLIAFQANAGSGYQIYTVKPNGHDLRQITHLDGDALHADWSPDGRRIAFAVQTEADCSNLAIMNADGSHLKIVAHSRDICEDEPSFTPDGSRLVFEQYDIATDTDALWSMKLDGSDRHRIIAPPYGGTDPNVSPDGRTISFVGYNGLELGQALFTVHMDGTGLTRITPFETDVAIKQDWAPDGRHLVYTDNADTFDQPANVVTVRPDGTGSHDVTHFQNPDLRAYVGSYSPDGQWIIFRVEDHGRYALYRARPDGSDRHAIQPFSDFRPRGIDWGAAAGS